MSIQNEFLQSKRFNTLRKDISFLKRRKRRGNPEYCQKGGDGHESCRHYYHSDCACPVYRFHSLHAKKWNLHRKLRILSWGLPPEKEKRIRKNTGRTVSGRSSDKRKLNSARRQPELRYIWSYANRYKNDLPLCRPHKTRNQRVNSRFRVILIILL